MSIQHFEEGIDPTTIIGAVTKADLLQLVRAAEPADQQGYIILSPTAPDVVAHPKLKSFIWIKTEVDFAPLFPLEIYYYDGFAWASLPLADGARLANGSVTLAKINISAADPLDILQVNSTKTALIFTTILDSIAADSLDISKLSSPEDPGSYFLTAINGVKQFWNATTIGGFLANNSIPILKLERPAAATKRRALLAAADGTTLVWDEIDIGDLEATGALGGQSLRRSSDNQSWEFYSPIGAAGEIIFEERQAANTPGGTFTAGSWQNRTMTTEVVDTGNVAAVAAGSMVLSAGTYLFEYWAIHCHSGTVRHRLYNETAAAVVANSLSLSTVGADPGVNITDHGAGRIVLAAQSSFKLQGFCSIGEVNTGFGSPSNIDGQDEIYSRVRFQKVQ